MVELCARESDASVLLHLRLGQQCAAMVKTEQSYRLEVLHHLVAYVRLRGVRLGVSGCGFYDIHIAELQRLDVLLESVARSNPLVNSLHLAARRGGSIAVGVLCGAIVGVCVGGRFTTAASLPSLCLTVRGLLACVVGVCGEPRETACLVRKLHRILCSALASVGGPQRLAFPEAVDLAQASTLCHLRA